MQLIEVQRDLIHKIRKALSQNRSKIHVLSYVTLQWEIPCLRMRTLKLWRKTLQFLLKFLLLQWEYFQWE